MNSNEKIINSIRASAPAEKVIKEFGFTVDNVVSVVKSCYQIKQNKMDLDR